MLRRQRADFNLERLQFRGITRPEATILAEALERLLAGRRKEEAGIMPRKGYPPCAIR